MRKVIHRYSNFFLLIILLLSITNCKYKPELPENFNFKGKLLYIEDKSGDDGMGMGHFGDIVVLDPKTKKEYYLTNDVYINLHPSINTRTNKLIFESKRDEGLEMFGFNSPSHLYEMDLKTFRIRQFDRNFKEKVERNSPTFNKSGDKVAYAVRKDYKYNVMIYDIKKDSVYRVKKIEKKIMGIDVSWNNNYLLIEYLVKRDLITYDGTLELLNLNTNDLTVLSKKGWDYGKGSILGNVLIYTGVDQNSIVSYLYSYNLSTKENKVIYKTLGKTFYFNCPQYAENNKIYFIKIEYKSEANKGRKNDIWSLDLKTNKLTAITKNGYEKDNLILIR